MLDRSALLASRPRPVWRIQAGLLVELVQVFAGGYATPAWANFGLWNPAIGLSRPAAHTFIVRWISLLHSGGPRRSKHAS